MGEPGEDRRLAGPGDREPCSAEQLGPGDRADGEADGPEQAREVADPVEEHGAEHEVGEGDRSEGDPLAADASDLAVEEVRRGGRGQRGRDEEERGGERLDPAVGLAELDGDRDRDEQAPEDRREPDHGPVHGLALGDEADALGNRSDQRSDQEAAPALAERDHGGGGEQDGDEARPEEGQLLVLDERHERDEHGADEPEGGHELGAPGEGNRRGAGGDARGGDQRPRVGDEPVERRGCEERGEAARDACADGGERRVRRPEAPLEPEAPREDGERGRGAEAEAQLGADPAAVHGEHEEEDDSEDGHDRARPGEPERAGELREVDLAPGARRAGRSRRLHRAGGRSLGRGLRRSGGGRRRRRSGRRGLRAGGHADRGRARDDRPEPRDLGLEREEAPLQVTDASRLFVTRLVRSGRRRPLRLDEDREQQGAEGEQADDR